MVKKAFSTEGFSTQVRQWLTAHLPQDTVILVREHSLREFLMALQSMWHKEVLALQSIWHCKVHAST